MPNNTKEHTSGPWVVDDRMEYVVNDADGVTVAGVGIDARTVGECHANARLIAAAPELLEAAELAKGLIEAELGITTRDDEYVINRLRNAIAKAEGREETTV